MACALVVAMSKCTHYLDEIKERQCPLGADDSKVTLVLSGLQDIIGHYEAKRRALLKELRAPPTTSIPIANAVRTLDFVKVYRNFWFLLPFPVLTYIFIRADSAGFETVP
jgi:hypothetical protein